MVQPPRPGRLPQPSDADASSPTSPRTLSRQDFVPRRPSVDARGRFPEMLVAKRRSLSVARQLLGGMFREESRYVNCSRDVEDKSWIDLRVMLMDESKVDESSECQNGRCSLSECHLTTLT